MRYFQPKEYQYISQYTPEMAAMDYKKGQDLLKQEDEFQKNLFDTKNKYHILEGTYSRKEDVDAANQHIQTNLDAISKDFHSGKINASDANNRISMLANYFNTNKNIQGLWNEGQNTLNIDRKRIAENSLTNAVNGLGPNVFSFDGKNLVSKKFNKEELADLQPMLHNYIQEGDFTKFTNEVLQQLKPDIVKEDASKEGLSISYKTLPDGTSIPFYTNIDGTRVTKGVLEQKVRPLIRNWINANHNNSNVQQVLFSKFLNQNDEQSKKTLEDRMVQTYTGYFTDVEDNTRRQSTPLGGTKGKKEEDEVPKETAIQSTTTISGSKIKYLNAEGKEYSITDPIKFQTELLNNRQVIKNKVDKFKSSLESTYPGVSFDVRSENNSNYIVPIIPDNYDKSKISNINASIATINKNLIENGIKQIAAERALIDVKTVWKNNYEKDLGPLSAIYLTKAQEQEAINDLGIDNYKYLIGSIQDPTHDKVVKAFKDKINYYNQFSNKNALIAHTSQTPLMHIIELNKGLAEFEKNYETNIKTVNPAYKAYIELVKQATDNITYKDQTLLSLDDKPESSKLKDLMFENLTDQALFVKNVRNADSNTDLGSLKNDLKDPEYLKIVKERLASGAKVFYNKETNLWESYIELPNTDKNKGNHKLIIAQDLNQPFIASFAESRGFSYNYYKVLKEHDYYSSINDAGFGMIKSNMTVDKNQDGIDDTEYDYKLNSNVIKTIGLNLVTQQVKVNTKYTDKSTGLVINLDKGNTVFEIPELLQTQGILFKTQDEQGLMRFHNDLDHAVASKNEIAINSILSNINTYGIQPINNPTAYENFDRDRKLNYDESVEIKKETDKLNTQKSYQDSQRELKILNALRQGWITDNNAEWYRQNPNYEYLDRDLKNAEANFKLNKEKAAKFSKDNKGK